MGGDVRTALKGRFVVNGDNSKARLVDVFDIMRDGEAMTVVLLRYPAENDLAIRRVDEIFDEFSVFWEEVDADSFIAGHGSEAGGRGEDDVKPSVSDLHTLSGRIKAARMSASRTKRQLARMVGVSPHAIRKWERGDGTPRRQKIAAIARACGISITWLLTGRGPRREEGYGS